jgi:hypothetical protein
MKPRSALAVPAYGALGFEGVAEPDSTAAAAPVAVGLLGGQAQLLRQRGDPEILEPPRRGGCVEGGVVRAFGNG